MTGRPLKKRRLRPYRGLASPPFGLAEPDPSPPSSVASAPLTFLFGRFLNGLKLRLKLTSIALALCWLLPAAAAEPIRAIVVEGNRRIEKDAIVQSLLSKPGEDLRRSFVREDIRRVYRMGYFDRVDVYYDEGAQALKVVVAEKKVIRAIKFAGNKEKDTEDLEKETQVKAYAYVDENKVKEDVARLKTLYEAKGYYLVEITPEYKDVAEGEVELTYRVVENRKVKIERINFIGNKLYKDSELKAVMLTKEKGFLSFLTSSGTYQQEMLDHDRQQVWDHYRKHGYFRSSVSAPFVQMSPDRRSLTATFTVEEGEQYKFGAIDIDGELIRDKAELMKLLKSKEGAIASSADVVADMQKLSSLYADEGYAYANVIPQDRMDDAAKIVAFTFLIQPGEKVRIERIRISGNTSTRDKVIRREMQIAEGDEYDWTKIKQSKESLDRLSIFEEVKITTPKASSDDTVDLVVEIKEKQTGTISLGAGFSTLDSFQIIGKIEKRNVFGYGVDLIFDAQLGARTQIFNLQYRDEHFLDTKWGLTVNAFNIDRRYSSFDLTTRGASVGFDYPLYVRFLERWRLGLTYSIVDKILSNLSPTIENLFQGGVISSVTTGLSRDTRNRVFEPTKGSLLKISEEFAGSALGGDHSFSKTEFNARFFYPVGKWTPVPILEDAVFAVNFDAGYVAPLDAGDRVPLFERYFPGGILNLRGFPIRSLGPKIKIASSTDPGNFTTSDFVIGGNKQVILNAEYIFPLIKPANIKGVLFFDMGNAFDNGESPFTLAGQRQSVGFGIRWFSPIGPLRFEWGYPLDRKGGEKPSVFDFTIGSIF